MLLYFFNVFLAKRSGERGREVGFQFLLNSIKKIYNHILNEWAENILYYVLAHFHQEVIFDIKSLKDFAKFNSDTNVQFQYFNQLRHSDPSKTYFHSISGT